MSTESRGVEFFVGLFLLIGFGMIAAMVLIFGRAAQGMQKSYPIIVQFPNASGLVKGCDVLISGAVVGRVAQAPALIGDNYAVAVPLHIKQGIWIPRTSNFQIRSNGMLGDAYIDVIPPLKYTDADFARPEEVIAGRRAGGLDELTAKGGVMMDTLNDEILRKLSAELDEIKITTTSINTRLLTDKNLRNIEDTFANLKQVTGDFSKTAKDLDVVVNKAQEAIDSVKSTMKTADASAAEVKVALGDVRKTADTATRTIDSARLLINKASTGEGTFGALISDKQMAVDLKALIANMRRSGVVFYKDRPLAPAPPPTIPEPKKRR